jgi:hypothetical protein
MLVGICVAESGYLKLGTSPQLECWNIGKMGLGTLQYWVNGKIRLDDNVKNG